MTATLTKWYEDHGRHEIFAGGKEIGLRSREHSMKVNAEHAAFVHQTDLDDLGIAKTAREEKIRARDHISLERASFQSLAFPRPTAGW